MPFRAAFYKGTRPGLAGVMNRLGRLLQNGPYSHVEIQFSDGMSASSTFEDGGVRFKDIGYSSGNWDFIDLPPQLEVACRKYYKKNLGVKYDTWGNIRFLFGLARQSPDKLFCSESASESVGYGLGQGFRIGPVDFYDLLKFADYYSGACRYG